MKKRSVNGEKASSHVICGRGTHGTLSKVTVCSTDTQNKSKNKCEVACNALRPCGSSAVRLQVYGPLHVEGGAPREDDPISRQIGRICRDRICRRICRRDRICRRELDAQLASALGELARLVGV